MRNANEFMEKSAEERSAFTEKAVWAGPQELDNEQITDIHVIQASFQTSARRAQINLMF